MTTETLCLDTTYCDPPTIIVQQRHTQLFITAHLHIVVFTSILLLSPKLSHVETYLELDELAST